MSALYDVFKSKGAKEKKNSKWATSRTAGKTSPKTLLVNKTNKKLLLRDKIGTVYSDIRYEIPAKCEIEVTMLEHTCFTLIPYAIDEEVEQQGNDAQETKIKRTIDTNLTIYADRLVDCKEIVISVDESEYELRFVHR